ncbi:hypothetical protein AH553_25310 [Salmonella enterica subsp. diarizonae]|uniref:hypothetical protein n=1 Tax=Salmonella enterica TaxID=28901 RepID=UPI0012BA078A|nr:hypothetical protein [Salmonella enterica]EBQ5246056.1 hypothetical protein [Salmonella enterica subsp. salamae]EDM1758403.1 hypothetical protein [Salmonella enterica subsp. diarizonae]
MIKKSFGAFLCLPFSNAPGKQPKAPAASLTESTSNTTSDYFARIRLLMLSSAGTESVVKNFADVFLVVPAVLV